MGAAYTQTEVLAEGRAKGSAEEIEELGRELGLAGLTRSTQQANHHRDPQRLEGWGGRSVMAD